jgi:hypothetical protein
MGYEEVVTLTDPTGKKEGLYRARYYYARGNRGTPNADPNVNPLWTPAQSPPKVNEQTCRGCTRAIDGVR